VWHAVAAVFAQTAPSGDTWLTSILTGLGSAGLSTGLLWNILQRREATYVQERDAAEARYQTERLVQQETIRSLTDRLFSLADTGTKVAQSAAEVVKDKPDPALSRQLARIEALLNERGGPR
jgi:hypothetical protein